MPMMKITSGNKPNSADGPWQTDNPNTPWFVAGIAYTDSQPHIDYFTKRNYVVEAGSPDADYLAAVAKLKNQALRTSTHSSIAPDMADAYQRNYFL